MGRLIVDESYITKLKVEAVVLLRRYFNLGAIDVSDIIENTSLLDSIANQYYAYKDEKLASKLVILRNYLNRNGYKVEIDKQRVTEETGQYYEVGA